MGKDTKIEWADHTWNPWIGCTKVSPACDHCYAEDLMDRRYGRVRWGAGEDRARTSAATWNDPLRWNRAAAKAGKRATVFCLSLGDIWDNEVDPLWRRQAFDVMERTPNLTYLLLSKRIGNAMKMCDPLAGNSLLPRNAALGATVINQDEWDRDVPKLCRAAEVLAARFSFVSIEPMLGAIDTSQIFGLYEIDEGRWGLKVGSRWAASPDWVIAGGESGPHARPTHPDWLRSLRDQCQAADVPFFMKQWGEWAPADDWPSEIQEDYDTRGLSADGVIRVGKARAGRLLDGRQWSETPA